MPEPARVRAPKAHGAVMPIRKDLRHFYTGPDWKAAREACRDRAGDRCEQCGAVNGWVGFFLALRTFIGCDPGNGTLTHWRTFLPRRRVILIQCGAAHLNNV